MFLKYLQTNYVIFGIRRVKRLHTAPYNNLMLGNKYRQLMVVIVRVYYHSKVWDEHYSKKS